MQQQTTINEETDIRLVFVDLDGTLFKGDLFAESILYYLVRNWYNIFYLISWLAAGRSTAKAMLARQVSIQPDELPYRTSLIDYLKQRKASGHKIILATASHWKWAMQIAKYLGFFDHVIATRRSVNQKGRNKLHAIESYSFSKISVNSSTGFVW